MRFEPPVAMQIRPHLRLVGAAESGGLVSGWVSARPVAAPVTLMVRDLAGPLAVSLRAGVSFGLHDVRRVADVADVGVRAEWTSDPDVWASDDALQVVVAEQDPPPSPVLDANTSIYTCPLDEWRPEAWSVAVSPAASWPPTVEWHPALTRHGAASLNERFLQRTGQPMDAAAWRGWMAVKVAYDLAARRAAGEDDLLAMTLDGHKGQPLRFGDDAHLIQPTYRIVAEGRPVVVAPRAIDTDN